MIFFSLILLVTYSFACLSLGLVLLRCFLGREAMQTECTPIVRVTSAFLLGGGVLANVWLGLSLLPGRWFTLCIVSPILLAAAAIGAVAAARALGAIVRHFAISLKTVCRSHWVWAVLVIAGLALPLLYALAAALPPRSDAVAWYFALPKLLAYEGSLRPLPGFEFFSQVGMHGEYHVSALMLLGSPQAATMFCGFMGVVVVLVLIEIARTAGIGMHGRWTIFLLTYTSTAFTYLTFSGRLDLFGVAMSLAAIYWALRQPMRVGGLILVGVLGCFGVLGKATYALTTVPMLVILLFWRAVVTAPKGSRVGAVIRAWGWCLLAAAIVFLTHVVKNAVLHGPSYALAPFIYPEDGYDWAGETILTNIHATHVLSCWLLAVFVGQFPGMFGTMSTGILALWSLVVVLPRKERFFRSTLVQLSVVGLMGACVFILLQTCNFSLRYFLPPLLLLTLAPATAVDYVWNSPKVRYVLKVGIAVVLVMTLAERFNRPKGHPDLGLKYILGRASMLDASETSAIMCQAVNDHAQPGDRVFLGMKYPYFLQPELLASSSSSEERLAVSDQTTPEDRWRELYKRGFRFVCVGPLGGTLFRKDQGFFLRQMYGWLDSRSLPAELELRCLYFGPTQTRADVYATYELRHRQSE